MRRHGELQVQEGVHLLEEACTFMCRCESTFQSKHRDVRDTFHVHLSTSDVHVPSIDFEKKVTSGRERTHRDDVVGKLAKQESPSRFLGPATHRM